jgi:hypothetical protein
VLLLNRSLITVRSRCGAVLELRFLQSPSSIAIAPLPSVGQATQVWMSAFLWTIAMADQW